MATRTITHLYDTYDEAARAVDALEAAGIPHSDISLVGADGRDASRVPTVGPDTSLPVGSSIPVGSAMPVAAAMPGDMMAADTTAMGAGSTTEPAERSAATGAGAGATLGTVVGGGAGLLAGIGALAIPGVGPVVAAGWLIATLTGAGAGAAAGSLLGALTGAGVTDTDAHVYAEGVRRGGTLLSVRITDAQVNTAQVEEILASTHAVDINQRGTDYRAGGWDRFDPAAPSYTPGQAQAEVQHDRDRRTAA